MANLSALASDDNNTEFMGARDPDSMLHVRFHEVALQNNFQSEKQGRPIFETVIFTEIHTPGNQLTIIDRPKIQRDEIRFPKQWAFFKSTHSDDPAQQGTPLTAWPFLDVARAEMLRAMKFFTIEQIAGASDEQIGRIGMLAGCGALAFRDKAKAYLSVARDANAVAHKEESLKAAEAKSEAQAAQIVELKEMVQRLVAQQAQAPEALPARTKKYHMTPEHKAKMKAAREAARAAKG